METVLVPVDFSDATPKIVEVAATFAMSLKVTRVVLLYVVEPITEYVPLAVSMDVLSTPVSPVHPLDHHPLMKRLERLANSLRQSGLEVITEVQMGIAMDEILKRAQFYKCDLIILGSHGHGALYHLFTGGVVTGVLKKTQLPVLIVPIRG